MTAEIVAPGQPVYDDLMMEFAGGFIPGAPRNYLDREKYLITPFGRGAQNDPGIRAI